LPRADITYWREVDFGGTWQASRTRQLMELNFDHDEVEDRFLDQKLEARRRELISAARALMDGTGRWGGPSKVGKALYDLDDLDSMGMLEEQERALAEERRENHREELGKVPIGWSTRTTLWSLKHRSVSRLPLRETRPRKRHTDVTPTSASRRVPYAHVDHARERLFPFELVHLFRHCHAAQRRETAAWIELLDERFPHRRCPASATTAPASRGSRGGREPPASRQNPWTRPVAHEGTTPTTN